MVVIFDGCVVFVLDVQGRWRGVGGWGVMAGRFQ